MTSDSRGFSVGSEVGRLRRVMLHRPGLELDRLTIHNKDELLFDDILWLEEAQREHDAFADLPCFLPAPPEPDTRHAYHLYTPLIDTDDPGEDIPAGSLLIANYGKGTYIYTALVWYRQLDYLVPGGYRVFANMLSLPKVK